MGSNAQMNHYRGCRFRKTIVAFMSMLLALDNGFQACLMAPTEILANQHFIGLSELANELNTKYLQVQPRHLLEKSFMKSWKTAIYSY
jgi:RecG-like helicase